MPKVRLTMLTRIQGANRALIEGTIVPHGFDLDMVEVPVLVQGFRRMVRDLEFDVSEMAFTTYLCAREQGVKFTAIPVFLVRAFHHGAILRHIGSKIDHPKSLEGRQVGINRGYTVTTGVWARGILQDEYGVDLQRVQWVRSGDEHVPGYQPPTNVRTIAPGDDLTEMLVTDRLDAAIGLDTNHPAVESLIPFPVEAGLKALRTRSHYPINHLVVIRDEVLDNHPAVSAAIFEAFAAAKRSYVQALRAGTISSPTAIDIMNERVMGIIGDPLPYGIEPNRLMIDTLISHAIDQGILTTRPKVEDLFAPDTLQLQA